MANYDPGVIELRDILLLLRRKIRLIFLTIAIVLGLAAVFLTSATPLYTASTLLFVDPSSKSLLEASETSAPNSRAADAIIESEVEILRSDAIALATIEKAGLLSDPEFGPSLSLLDKVLQAIGISSGDDLSGQQLLNATLTKFKEAITVRRQGLTYVVSVSVTSQSPERAAELANTISEVYIEQQVSSKVEASLAARDVLKAQLDTAQANLARSEQELSTYIDDNLDRLAEESGSAQVVSLRAQLLQAQSNRADLENTLATSQTAFQSGNWERLTSSLESEALQALETERQRLARQLGQAEPGTQEALDLRTELESLEKELRREGQSSIQELQADISNFERIGQETREQVRRELLAADLSAATLSEIYALQQEATIARDQYDTLLARMRGLETQSLVEIANSRVVSQALPPNSPSFPNTKLILALALVTSAGLGIGLAFLNEYYVGGVTSEQQLASLIPTQVAAVIPGITPGRDQVSVADAILDQPMSYFSESFRRLRASIDRRLSQTDGGNVIMVTSATAAEGKSTISLSLARTYAMSGKRVLVIDADMRKPTLHKYLGVEPESGLLDYLRDGSDGVRVEGFYFGDRTPGLGALLGSRRSDVPTDQLLQSEKFRSMIESARKNFDILIVDTPPLLPVVDSRYIAPHADCAILCARFDETSQADLRRAFEQLAESLNDTGVALSLLNFHENTDRGYRYGGYYGYSSET